MGMFDKARKAAADTLTEDIKMVDIDNLIESPDNFFELTRIPEFAETILGQGGVKENLIVKPISGGDYEIISGHRRRAAVQYLLDNGENISHFLPCLVQQYEDDDEKILDLILMNISARILSDAQMWKSYEIVNDLLQKKKQLGEKFGQMQKKLAEILGVSTGQVAKMQYIDKHAIKEIKTALENGDIAIHTAEKLSKVDKDKLEKIVTTNTISDIKPKDIENIEKVTINDSFFDDENDSEHYDEDDDGETQPDKKENVTTNDNSEADNGFSKTATNKHSIEKRKSYPLDEDNLYGFMVGNNDIICDILNAYLKVTDDQRERNLISNIKDFMRYACNVKENSNILKAILDTYLGITDKEDERIIIADIKIRIKE